VKDAHASSCHGTIVRDDGLEERCISPCHVPLRVWMHSMPAASALRLLRSRTNKT
jgi:hypothetical protein